MLYLDNVYVSVLVILKMHLEKKQRMIIGIKMLYQTIEQTKEL